MIKIALTGNIASGKSFAQSIFSKHNFKTLDCDSICHNLLNFDKKTICEIKDAFLGFDIFDDGIISRKKLFKIVFNNSLKKKDLENILHPKVKKIILKFFEENKNEKITFVQVPLLFEAKMENMFDKIIFISSNLDNRLLRLKLRSNLSDNDALKVINSQINEESKMEKSHYIIENNGTLEEFEKKIENLILLLT